MTSSTLIALPLSGALVSLREFAADDINDVHAIVGDDRVTQWLSFDSRDRSQAESMLSGIVERSARVPRDEWYLAVEVHGNVVGFVRLALSGVRAGKLGYSIAAQHWGKGYATDAARTMIRFGFDSLDLHRVSAAIGPENAASITVAEKLGMTCEGRIRDHVFTNRQWRDSLLFAVLADELR